jgi:hypothetical protein
MSRNQSLIAYCRDIPPQFTELDLKEVAAPAAAVGFPRSLVFRGQQVCRLHESQSFAALYFPVFETFIDAANCRKLTYQWIWGGTFHVDVLDHIPGGWLLYKFESGRLLWHVSAREYEDAVSEAIMHGLEANEPAGLETGAIS